MLDVFPGWQVHNNEVPYLYKVMPEILWQAFLNERYGVKETVEITMYLLETIRDATNLEKGKLYCFISNFELLNEKQIDKILAHFFRNPNYKKIEEAIRPFINVFPECPLSKLFYNPTPEFSQNDLEHVKNIINKMLSKMEKEATFCLANIIYYAFQMNVLKVNRDSELFKLNEIEHYPETEESKKLASFLRASINPFVANDNFVLQKSNWSKYFWNRAYQLDPYNIDDLYFD